MQAVNYFSSEKELLWNGLTALFIYFYLVCIDFFYLKIEYDVFVGPTHIWVPPHGNVVLKTHINV